MQSLTLQTILDDIGLDVSISTMVNGIQRNPPKCTPPGTGHEGAFREGVHLKNLMQNCIILCNYASHYLNHI